MNEEENFLEIDEDTLIEVRWGIVKYSAIFIIFVFLPLLITLLTSNTLSKLNIFAEFVGMTLICIDQIINLSRFLYLIDIKENEEEQESN